MKTEQEITDDLKALAYTLRGVSNTWKVKNYFSLNSKGEFIDRNGQVTSPFTILQILGTITDSVESHSTALFGILSDIENFQESKKIL